MIIGIKLQGGLGNMLFQIAFGESVAHKYNCDVVYTNIKENFNYIKTHYSRSPYADDYFELFPNFEWFKNQDRLPEITKTKHIPFHYVDVVPENGTNYIGYFQSEKYFFNRYFIRELFRFNKTLNYYVLEKYEPHTHNICSIHVRRADYLTMPDFHPSPGMDYYQTAIDMFGRYNIDKYFIFSDDMQWCKENFNLPNAHFIHNKDYIDLLLMSMCNYHIIANSSLSWWGAYLNGCDMTIAPKQWLGKACTDNYKDVVPHNWITI